MFTYTAKDLGDYGRVNASYPVTREEAKKILALHRPDWVIDICMVTARSRWENSRSGVYAGMKVPGSFRRFNYLAEKAEPVPGWGAVDRSVDFLLELTCK